MIADLYNIQFQSDSFAKLICREHSLSNLQDGTLYLLPGEGCEWCEAVDKVKVSIEACRMKSIWHLPYSIELLSDLSLLSEDERLLQYMDYREYGYNMLMPLYTPDRAYKCYFIGRLEDVSRLEYAFALLTVDAQSVADECSFAAFVTSADKTPEAAKQVWCNLLDRNLLAETNQGSAISFRGKYNTSISEYAFLGKGFEKMISVPKMEYVDFVSNLKKFPDTIDAILKGTTNDSFDCQMEYVKLCQNLSEINKNELILELAKRIQDRRLLAEAVDAVINKAKSSRLKVKLVSKKTKGLIDGRRIHGEWCTYLVDESGKMQWLDFEPAAHVIYIMNLIYRVHNPDTPAVVEVRHHEKFFVAIYNAIYGGGGEEQYNRLIRNVEKKSGEGYERKRLKDCYKIITNCVNLHCSFFNESPSPYVTNYDKPLTIDADLIEISDAFKNLERLKWIFFEK